MIRKLPITEKNSHLLPHVKIEPRYIKETSQGKQ
jgi:hypothetical protein